MGRSARDRRPDVRPVEKIELREENHTLRAVLAVLFLLIGMGALGYGISGLFSVDSGWQTIQAGTSDGPNCGDEFTFLYELGASGQSARIESRALTQCYTQVCQKAYQLFHGDESYEGIVNLRDINQRPNETLEVDQALYRAFEKVREAGDRTIYLGPVVARYDDLFFCQDDAMLVDFDPRLSQEVAEEYAAVAAYAMDPSQIDVELLGENQICLRVSEEYLAYARDEGIDRFLDFGWMRNAFVADFLAETMLESGYTCGSITSQDGFARCLDGRAGSYGLNLMDELDGRPIAAGTMEYQGPMSLVTLRTFPAVSGDEQRYYRLRNGEIRTLYLDPRDGLCKGAADSIVCYAPNRGCAQLAMEIAPAFIADVLGADLLWSLSRQGVQYIWCRDRTFYASDPHVSVTNLYEGYTLKTVDSPTISG